jgi:hypothetical protein
MKKKAKYRSVWSISLTRGRFPTAGPVHITHVLLWASYTGNNRRPWQLLHPRLVSRGDGNARIPVKKSEISAYLAPITHKGLVSGCGIGTYHPCIALNELDRGNSAPMAVVAASSRVQEEREMLAFLQKKSEISIYLVPITQKRPVSGCGIGTHRPCVTLSELDREEPASMAIMAASSRCCYGGGSTCIPTNTDLRVVGPYHSQGAGFRLRDRHIAHLCCSERARQGG